MPDESHPGKACLKPNRIISVFRRKSVRPRGSWYACKDIRFGKNPLLQAVDIPNSKKRFQLENKAEIFRFTLRTRYIIQSLTGRQTADLPPNDPDPRRFSPFYPAETLSIHRFFLPLSEDDAWTRSVVFRFSVSCLQSGGVHCIRLPA